MNAGARYRRYARRVIPLVAVAFGFATVVAGGRVLAGADPGYLVFRPLLIYNTVMGFVYAVAGVVMWRSLARGVYAAGTVFGLNLVVLGGLVSLYVSGGAVADDSVRAMTFRTAVWLILFLGAGWVRSPGPTRSADS